MRKFGLIGFPLGHSFSKQYFTDKFKAESISGCSYENYELTNLSRLKELILNNAEICGLNVTIPFKSEIINYLDQTDNEAAETGAVNVLKISGKGDKLHIKGFNTDIFGFRESLIPNIKGCNINSAIILGTGGSSKAVAAVLKKLGIGIVSVSRRSGAGSISYNELTDKILIENQLIVNTTPLGMFPHIDIYPDLNYNCLTRGHILYDLVYNPGLTAFLKKGKERGCKTIGGLNMLHLQAEKSWEIWNNKDI
ncbi:MAG: shikimate dehydrogenase [Odoribacter sp.]|nr:shikimate dehydrogenase [Odoribacter sp.]